MKLDILIRGGRALDAALGLNQAADVGIRDGKIVLVGDAGAAQARESVDASGCWVTPGLIDYHAHVFFGGSSFGMPSGMATFCNGITTMVDGGSVGEANFEAFYQDVIVNNLLTIKAMLYVSSGGQPAAAFRENLDPAQFDEKRILMMCEKYRDVIVALKIKHSRAITGEFGLEPLRATVALAEKARLPVCAHVKDPPGETVGQTLDILRAGDIFCHVFHEQGLTILDADGQVLPEVRAARARGVLFDMAQGSSNLSLRVAGLALEQGFPPDIVSSDVSLLSAFKPPAYGFAYILSELLNLGMAFEDIIARCTRTPAKLIGLGDAGFLRPGAPADIAIFRIIKRDTLFRDNFGNTLRGNLLVKPEATMKDGIFAFRQVDFIN